MPFSALSAAGVALAQASPSFSTSPTPFITLFIVGFAIGVFGHLAGSRLIVAFGIMLVFVATLILPLALSLSN